MMNDAANAAYLLTQKTAEDYRKLGYQVVLNPTLEFFPGLTPDLLARKGDEVRVVEVKTRSSLAANPLIGELARVLQSMPGWSLDLVVVPEPERFESPEGAGALETDGIARRIHDAEKSLDAGLLEAAFVLAWSASEAAIRNLVAGLGAHVPYGTSPRKMLDHAVYVGVLSRDDYTRLNVLSNDRNAIVHGFTPKGFDRALVAELLDLARRMAADASGADESSSDSDYST